MKRFLVLFATLVISAVAGAHSLTTDTPFENGLSHFRDGDYETARTEWLEGAALDDSGAQFGLGLMYYTGKGVEQNYVVAFEWMQKAARNGNFNAQNNLGVMYLQGQGVEQDLVQAFAWYSIAAEQGQRDAQKNVDILNEQLSPEQRTETQMLIAEIKQKYVVW